MIYKRFFLGLGVIQSTRPLPLHAYCLVSIDYRRSPEFLLYFGLNEDKIAPSLYEYPMPSL